MVLGDFNSIAADHERKGGAPNFAIRSMRNFCSMIQECNLLDAGFQGSKFTWKSGRLQQRGRLIKGGGPLDSLLLG